MTADGYNTTLFNLLKYIMQIQDLYFYQIAFNTPIFIV